MNRPNCTNPVIEASALALLESDMTAVLGPDTDSEGLIAAAVRALDILGHAGPARLLRVEVADGADVRQAVFSLVSAASGHDLRLCYGPSVSLDLFTDDELGELWFMGQPLAFHPDASPHPRS